MDMTAVREYVALVDLKQHHEGEAKRIAKDIERAQTVLLDEFAKDGVQHVNLDARTVYVRRQLWASAKGLQPDLCAAMKELGLSVMVKETVNSMTLSGWVRELEQSPETAMPILPESLIDIVKVSEVFTLQVKKA